MFFVVEAIGTYTFSMLFSCLWLQERNQIKGNTKLSSILKEILNSEKPFKSYNRK